MQKIKLTVYFANFVLMDYGGGAIFGVLLMTKEIAVSQKNRTEIIEVVWRKKRIKENTQVMEN